MVLELCRNSVGTVLGCYRIRGEDVGRQDLELSTNTQHQQWGGGAMCPRISLTDREDVPMQCASIWNGTKTLNNRRPEKPDNKGVSSAQAECLTLTLKGEKINEKKETHDG